MAKYYVTYCTTETQIPSFDFAIIDIDNLNNKDAIRLTVKDIGEQYGTPVMLLWWTEIDKEGK